MTKYTPAQARSAMKYRKEKLDQLSITVPKGKKDEYKKYAELQGKSLNQFVVDCVNEKILDIEFFADK